MLEYVYKNKSAWRTLGLQLILTPQSYLKNFEFASAWKVSIPSYIFMQFLLQIALDVGNFCYTRVA
jgi:hypothetical protein